jgi:prepilin-type N-terminal cleavage/methylation domain-containing protein
MVQKDSGSNGFTLLELSIVLVIIGLIIGGVVAGKELIRQAEIRSIIGDYQKYQTSVRAFQLKFNALPGDFTKATDYWPACTDDGTNTCNGNGDGRIVWSNTIGESYRAWQHMALAGVIEGSFTGTFSISGGFANSVAGVNVPAAKIGGNAAYSFLNNTLTSMCSSSASNFIHAASTMLSNKMGFGITSSTGGWGWSRVITPAEAQTIDDKFDDGKPGTGKLFGFCAVNQCADGNTEAATYNIDNTNKDCTLLWEF